MAGHDHDLRGRALDEVAEGLAQFGRLLYQVGDLQGPAAVPAPQPRRRGLVDARPDGAAMEAVPHAGGRFPVPRTVRDLGRQPALAGRGHHLLSHVEAVAQLAPENGDGRPLLVCLHGVAARQLGPVAVGVLALVDHQGPDSAAVGDHVVVEERPGQPEPGVGLFEEEVAVVVGYRRRRFLDPGVGRADEGPVTHRDDVEQPLIVVEERQHAPRLGHLGHDDVSPLRVAEGLAERGAGESGEFGGSRAGRVDQHRGLHGVPVAGQLVDRIGPPAVTGPLGAV